MRWLGWLLIVYLMLAGRIVFRDVWTSFPLTPDPLLVLGILVILRLESPYGLLWGAFIGLSADLLWGDRLAVLMLSLATAGHLLSGVRDWYASGRTARRWAAASLLATAVLLVRAGLERFLGGTAPDLEAMALRAGFEGVATGACVLALDRAISWIAEAWGQVSPAVSSNK